jgi:hypothetical protein
MKRRRRDRVEDKCRARPGRDSRPRRIRQCRSHMWEQSCRSLSQSGFLLHRMRTCSRMNSRRHAIASVHRLRTAGMRPCRRRCARRATSLTHHSAQRNGQQECEQENGGNGVNPHGTIIALDGRLRAMIRLKMWLHRPDQWMAISPPPPGLFLLKRYAVGIITIEAAQSM